MTVDFNELLDRAKYFSENNFEWHYHYLPPDCILNITGEHLLLLEAEGRQWQSLFDEKPMEELGKLEAV